MQSNSAKRQRLDVAEHQVRSNIIHPELDWNDTMKASYDCSWGIEIYNLMNDEPAEWSELGYYPNTELKCTMCGNSDHTATSCPNSCCLKCGEKTNFFQDECANCISWSSAVCEICGYRGHMKMDCPNHWKCYHSTIDTSTEPDYSMTEYPRKTPKRRVL